MESFVVWLGAISLLLDPPLVRAANDKHSAYRAFAAVALFALVAFQVSTLLVPIAMLIANGSPSWQVLR